MVVGRNDAPEVADIAKLLQAAGIAPNNVPLASLATRQLAKIGGLSPSFFTQLGTGNNERVPRRENLIRLGVALQLNFDEIDRLIAYFSLRHKSSYDALSTDDSELFIQIASSWQTSDQLHSLRDFYLDYFLLSLEAIPGNLCLVNTQLWYLFKSNEDIINDLRSAYDANDTLVDLLFKITLRRKSVIEENLRLGYKIDYLLYDMDLSGYIEKFRDENPLMLIHQLKATLEALERINFNFLITDRPLYFQYEMKYQPNDKSSEIPSRLFFMSRDPYNRTSNSSDTFLAGFATSSVDLMNQFQKDVSELQNTSFGKQRTIDLLKKHLNELA